MLVTIPIQAVIEVPDDASSYAKSLEAKAKIEQLLRQFNLQMVLQSQGLRVHQIIVNDPVPPTPQQPQQQPQYAQHTNGNGRR